MNQTNENHGKGGPGSAPGVEKRGVIDDDTPFLPEQDDLDAAEKAASAELVTPRRSA